MSKRNFTNTVAQNVANVDLTLGVSLLVAWAESALRGLSVPEPGTDGCTVDALLTTVTL